MASGSGSIGQGMSKGCATLYVQNYPIEKLAIQYSTGNPRIATTLFSSANPDNVLKNIAYAEEPADRNLVREVQEIIGKQMRVSWANS